MPSIGFKTADKIARDLGITLYLPFRIQSGIKYIINEILCSRKHFIPRRPASKKVKVSLEVRREELEENILHEVMKSKLMLERIGDVEGVFTMPYLYAEISVTKHMLELLLEGVDALDIPVKDYIHDFEKDRWHLLS